MLGRAEHLPVPQRDALRTAFGLACGPAAGPIPGRAGRAEPALGGRRGAAADLPGRRRAVAGSGVRAGAGVRGPAAGRRSGRAGVRGPGTGCGAGRVAGARSRRAARERRTGAAGLGAGRAAGRSGPGPDRGRGAGQPAGPARTAAGLSPAELAGGFGLPGYTARRDAAVGADCRELPQAAGGVARTVPAAPAAGGGRTVRRPSADLAGGRAAGHTRSGGGAAVDAGLVEFGTLVRFRHPLLRSAVRAASVADRQAVHGALAETAERLYQEAIDRLGRTQLRPDLARAYLLYGSGCAARAGPAMRAGSCGLPTACSRRSAWRRSPSAPAGS